MEKNSFGRIYRIRSNGEKGDQIEPKSLSNLTIIQDNGKFHVNKEYFSFLNQISVLNPKSLNSTQQIINIYGIAYALSLYHSNNIIYGNLSLETIFLDEHPHIADFGSSLNTQQRKKIKYGEQLIYTAPEVLQGEEYSKYSDIYSYSIILYQIITKRNPFENKNPYEIITEIVNGHRPTIPQETPECYRSLIEKCWSHNPKDRPSINEIVSLIENDQRFVSEISANFLRFQNYIKKVHGIQFNEEEEEEEKEEDKLELINAELIDFNLYQMCEKIGEGSFGSVYKIIKKETEEFFAAKTLKEIIIEEEENSESGYTSTISTKDFIISNEIIMLSRFNHPSIVKFIGYCNHVIDDVMTQLIIIEYCKKGSIDGLFEGKSVLKDWDNTKKLINIYGIASAMSYLHSLNILHLDLKSSNVLMDELLHPKVNDFGLSIDLSHNENKDMIEIKGVIIGTLTHMAPEILNNSIYSKASDVYSFGMTLYEILMNKKPFKGISTYLLINLVVNEDVRPDFEVQIPDCYKNLIEKCWSKRPEERPSFCQILDQLENNTEFINSFNVDADRYYNFVNSILSCYNPNNHALLSRQNT